MAEPARDAQLGEPAPDDRPSTSTGPGRVLVALYGIFALAAGVYLVATGGLVRGGRGGRRVASVAITVELAGVLIVGTLSLADPAAFPDETVWSAYGRGYGFVPLVLPVLGLLWLRRRRAPG